MKYLSERGLIEIEKYEISSVSINLIAKNCRMIVELYANQGQVPFTSHLFEFQLESVNPQAQELFGAIQQMAIQYTEGYLNSLVDGVPPEQP